MGIVAWAITGAYAGMADIFYKKFVRDTHKAGEVNREVLHTIINANAQTEYGRRYNFAGIKTAQEYKAQVP
ncbi:MAG: GH3 auxin-responsive promoter family protein, partial [Peptococcaceae bacterium]|nr:GH3 auxin-responsive promoter family protein [Peptococcaceae bacterium]